MEIGTWIQTLRQEGARMTAAARSAPADTPVPTCPDWVARDLIRHMGGVHRWATTFVAEGRTEPASATLEEQAGRGRASRRTGYLLAPCPAPPSDPARS